MDVVKLNLSQIEELGDLVGFPVKEFLVKNQEGKQRWITEAQVSGALKAGYTVADKRMSHAAPEWIQGKAEGGFLRIKLFVKAPVATMSPTELHQHGWRLRGLHLTPRDASEPNSAVAIPMRLGC